MSETKPESRSRRWPKLVLAGAVAGLLLVAWRLGVFQQFGDAAQLRETLLKLGPRGFLAFFLAVAFLQPCGVPGFMFVVVASLIWPAPEAIVLSVVSCTVASINGFAFSRYLARDWVETRIPTRLREYDERLATHGFTTVFLLRMIFSMNPTLHALFGISRVRFSTHVIASVAAYIPHIIALTYLGAAFVTLLKDQPLSRWLELAAALAIVGLSLWAFRRWRNRARPA